MDEHILVPWSGGLDSTFLVWRLLQDKKNVRDVYINLRNNSVKAVAEIAARRKLREVLATFSGNGNLIESYEPQIDVDYGQLFVMKQNCIWLLMLAYSCCENTKSVQMAYVMNDCSLSYMDEMQRLWASIGAFSDKALPPLEFPIIKWNKKIIKSTLPPQLLEHIWYCENPFEGKPCTKCDTCNRFNQS